MSKFRHLFFTMSQVRRRRGEKNQANEPLLVEDEVQTDTGSLALFLPGVIIAVFLFRLVNALTTRTFFQADEYYQGLEPAHNYIFGYGYVTWEWREYLRSSIHPLVYAVGYKIVQVAFGDHLNSVIVAPKIIGAILATIAEVYLYKFVQVYKNERVARICLVLSLINPFNWYFITRAFSNSFETVLIIIAFKYWPWSNTKGRYYISLIFAILSCIVRPTNGMIWMFLGLEYIFRVGISTKLVLGSAIEIIGVLGINTLLDYQFYGKLTFPVYNFLEFNVFKNLSIFYGVAPWHFYLVQAVPIMTMTLLPFLILGLKWQLRDPLVQAGLVMLVGFSFIDHKEFRFIYPLQPIMLMVAAKEIDRKWTVRIRWIALAMFVNVPIAYFLTQVNERGVLDILTYLPTHESVGFLTPCHSTPWQSHIHDPSINWWFLTCEPPLHLASGTLENVKEYRDESDKFYDDPVTFLETLSDWPARIVVFSPLEDLMAQYPTYTMCHRIFNSVIHWDDRRSGDLLVYCRDEVI